MDFRAPPNVSPVRRALSIALLVAWAATLTFITIGSLRGDEDAQAAFLVHVVPYPVAFALVPVLGAIGRFVEERANRRVAEVLVALDHDEVPRF